MKTRRTFYKIFIAAMMAVVLMVSFALTAFASINVTPMDITYYGYSYGITNESLIIYNDDNIAIGSIMINLVQTDTFSYYFNYQISMIDGKNSDYMGCHITKTNLPPASIYPTTTIIENNFVSGSYGTLQNTMPDVSVDITTESIVAELTIYYYNENTSLLEAYHTTFEFKFRFELVTSSYSIAKLISASYTQS